MKLNRILQIDALKSIFKILTPRDRFLLFLMALVQASLAFLDLAVVLFVGVLSLVAAQEFGIASENSLANRVIKVLSLSENTPREQIVLLGIYSIAFLLTKSALSIYFTKKIFYFLAEKSAAVSIDLTAKLISKPILFIQSFRNQELVFSLTKGIDFLIIQVIGTLLILFADISVLVVLGATLFIVDFSAAIGTLAIFGTVGLLLHFFMGSKASGLGQQNSHLTILGNEKLLEMIRVYRELYVSGKRVSYVAKIEKIRRNGALTTAELNFLPYVSKNVIESMIVIGAILVGSLQLLFSNVNDALLTISLFIMAGSRIAPSVLRIQQAVFQMRASISQVQKILYLVKLLEISAEQSLKPHIFMNEHELFIPKIEIKEMHFGYPSADALIFQDLNLEIEPLSAIGKSGAGKTTLIDLFLGILKPSSGEVLINGLDPEQAISSWPGLIGYVPQETVIVNGTVRENLALGFDVKNFEDQFFMRILRTAQLEEFVYSLPNGLDEIIGEQGLGLSGGQKQRLGIARALFTNPKILVLDEATSSLDGETEENFASAIELLKPLMTLIIVAHQEKTIQIADIILKVEDSGITVVGTSE